MKHLSNLIEEAALLNSKITPSTKKKLTYGATGTTLGIGGYGMYKYKNPLDINDDQQKVIDTYTKMVKDHADKNPGNAALFRKFDADHDGVLSNREISNVVNNHETWGNGDKIDSFNELIDKMKIATGLD